MALGIATPLSVPNRTRFALEQLEKEGFESWIVGGWVRDALLNHESSDIDIATAASWTDVKRIFTNRGLRVVETGSEHGTVTVIIEYEPLEITTFRVEGPYRDGRHPSYVTPATTIREDLARRDFTINAMAYHPSRGLLDPFGGMLDLERGVVRTVGSPDKRLAEDALRILRACRFVAKLGLTIEPSTRKAMQHAKHRLACVSAERISHELDRLLTGPFAGRALRESADILAVALPEIVACLRFDQMSPYHCYDVFEHIARTVDAAEPSSLVRWAALCHDLGKPAVFFVDEGGQGHFYGHAALGADIAAGIMKRLKMPTAFSERVVSLVRHHDDEVPPTRKAVAHLLSRLEGDETTLRALFELKRADSRAHAPEHRGGVRLADELERVYDDAKAAHEPLSIKDLALSGRDVMACGVPEGPDVGKALRAAFNAVMDDQIPNDCEALREFVYRWKKEEKDLDEQRCDQ